MSSYLFAFVMCQMFLQNFVIVIVFTRKQYYSKTDIHDSKKSFPRGENTE